MDDLISRQAAIQALDNAAENWNIAEPYHEGIRAGFRNSARLIMSLPSAQPELAQDLHNACTDTISRQAAIDELDKRFDSIPMEQTTEILLLRKDLRELPSVQPEQRWIPCSERLPEDDDDVIITTGFEMYIGWFDADDHTWRLRNDYITSIVAWMPLPEPYKSESED